MMLGIPPGVSIDLLMISFMNLAGPAYIEELRPLDIFSLLAVLKLIADISE